MNAIAMTIGITAAAQTIAVLYDDIMTARGIKAGVGVEGGMLMSKLWGPKPTFLRLLLTHAVLDPVLFFGMWQLQHIGPEYVYGFTVGWAVVIFKHFRGGLRWNTLLHGGTVSDPLSGTGPGLSWWQKLLHN
jgi:hypothetical protein